jgi:heme oxygenase
MPTNSIQSPPPSIIGHLRAQTHYLHERLEMRLSMKSQLISIDNYRNMLSRFYGIYAPMESVLGATDLIAAWVDIGIDFNERRKLALIESDLEALGLSKNDIRGIELCAGDLPPIPKSAAELAGCAYVLEGSTLGGRVIGRHLDTELGLRPGNPGARFFHGYGDSTGKMWHDFCKCIMSFESREEARRPGSGAVVAESAVTRARETFLSFESWLCG